MLHYEFVPLWLGVLHPFADYRPCFWISSPADSMHGPGSSMACRVLRRIVFRGLWPMWVGGYDNSTAYNNVVEGGGILFSVPYPIGALMGFVNRYEEEEFFLG